LADGVDPPCPPWALWWARRFDAVRKTKGSRAAFAHPTGALHAEGTHIRATAIALLLWAAGAVPVLAHGVGDVAAGFAGGFAHPLFGPDHVAAMVAVGLWGAVLGPPALWMLPVAFPLVMAFGGVLGITGVPIPRVEVGIAVSAVILGLMVALAVRAPLAAALAVVSVFAIFHGHAHGAELPHGADAVAFSAGFVVATGLLHLCGIGLGLAARWRAGRAALRLAGAAIAVAGGVFLHAALSS
jgi:urease accessory protein